MAQAHSKSGKIANRRYFTLDGRIEGSDAVFEAKFMLPWSFSEEAAAEKYMPQLQHNMWVVAARSAVLSVITGGGKWVEILVHADPLYQHLSASSGRCVESGEQPQLFGRLAGSREDRGKLRPGIGSGHVHDPSSRPSRGLKRCRISNMRMPSAN